MAYKYIGTRLVTLADIARGLRVVEASAHVY